jgi:hypothetical protein
MLRISRGLPAQLLACNKDQRRNHNVPKVHRPPLTVKFRHPLGQRGPALAIGPSQFVVLSVAATAARGRSPWSPCQNLAAVLAVRL